jgi:hypothetical protein
MRQCRRGTPPSTSQSTGRARHRCTSRFCWIAHTASVTVIDTQAEFARRHARDRADTLQRASMNALALMVIGLMTGCSGSPSRSILGSYFPSWMVCAFIGLMAALLARAALKATGLLGELPAPLVVLLSIGCATTFALWLMWLA